MHDDPIDQLGQQGTGEAVDVAVFFEMLDKRVCMLLTVGSGERGFQAPDALRQPFLLFLMLLLVHQVLIFVQEPVFIVGIKIGKDISDLFQLLRLYRDLLFDIDAFGGGLISARFFEHFIGIDRDGYHLLYRR